MGPQTHPPDSLRVHANNIGGIDETTVALTSGVTILAGRNATNRTSFLKAIMAAMGSDDVSLKGDAEEGSVELTLGDETYTRTLHRDGTEIHTAGSPYFSDPTKADLFAFLLEENEARQAVARGENLHEIIMRPVDTDEIQAEISQLEQEKCKVDEKIEEINTLDQRLPELESQKSSLESQIEEKEQKLQQKNRKLQEADSSVADSREGNGKLEKNLNELKENRSDLEEIKFQMETDQQGLEELKQKKSRLESTLEELPESVDQELSDITGGIDQLRVQRRELDSTLSDLQTVIEFNEEMLGNTSTEVLEELRDDSDQESVTEQLIKDDSVICWTCGSAVGQSTIEKTLDTLRNLQQEKASERQELTTEIDEMTDKRSELQALENERERVESQLEQIEDEQEQRKSSINDLKDRREELIETINELENQVDELEDDVQSEILDRHREVNQLEFELDQLESELSDTVAEIDSIESQLEGREELQQQREEIQDKLEQQRGRIDQIKREAVERFNDHMMEVLGLLDYSNLERIWIEQIQKEVREGRRKTIQDMFELHVVRSTSDGTTYEDTVDHLSESEREVTGLIFALAGYLVHDVHEELPLLLLDSLEAIDSERIADLIEYLEDYVDYLVVALLPEDATALDDRHERISNI